MTQQEMELAIVAQSKDLENLEKRMDKAEIVIEEIRSLTTSVQLMAQTLETFGDKVDKIDKRVEKLDAAPGESWNKVKTTVITAIISTLCGAAIAAIIALL